MKERATIPANTDEFVRLFVQNQRKLFAFVLTLLPRAADAEEVFQNVSVILWRKAGEFQPGTEFFNWACTIAHFEILNFRRRANRQRIFFGDALLDEIASERLSQADLHESRLRALAKCLGKLSMSDRELIERHYTGGDTMKAVAAQVGRPVNTVYKAVGRIRRALLDCIDRTLIKEEMA